MQRKAGPLAPIGNSGIGRASLRVAAVSRHIPFLATPTSTTHCTTLTNRKVPS